MNRIPSIHITKPQFIQILDEFGIKNFPTDQFFAQARRVSVNSRSVFTTNKKDTRKVNNILLASKGDASMVADIVYSIRTKLKHRGVRKVTENNKRDWTLCKDLANICNQFAEDFGFDNTRSAFITYIDIGFKKMGRDHRNVLTRLIAMCENIYAYYETKSSIQEDTDKTITKSIYNYYNKKVADATGIYEREDLENDPERYNHFLQIRLLCEENKWNYEDYVDAQFDGMAWCNGLPEPHNMYGPKAIERYKKFIYKYGKSETNTAIQGSLWSAINKN